MTKNTLSIFRLFLNRLPPFFPNNIVSQMEKALLSLESSSETHVEVVEDAMIKFGYHFWPYNEAYNEMYKEIENRLGEQFFISHLPDSLQDTFLQYSDYGLNWQDVYSGKAAQYYKLEDRANLSIALIKLKKELMRVVKREIIGLGRDKYLLQVKTHQKALFNIKNILKDLRDTAKKHKFHHPILADEIKDKVRHFEFGLCLLGPACKLEEVLQSVDFFNERKKHLDLLRGIDKPIEIDFFKVN